jgi:hypothetical protein
MTTNVPSSESFAVAMLPLGLIIFAHDSANRRSRSIALEGRGDQVLKLLVISALTRFCAMLDITTHKPCLILQLPSGALEGIIDGEGQIGIAFIRLRRTSHMNFATIGQREPNGHLVMTAGLMTIAGTFHNDAASGQPTEAVLQFCKVLIDCGLEFRRGLHTFEFDLGRRLHDHLRPPGGVLDHAASHRL